MCEKKPTTDKIIKKSTVLKVAEAMGVNPQFIRVGLQNGTVPIGSATKNPGGKWSYYISPKLLFEHTGIKLEDLR